MIVGGFYIANESFIIDQNQSHGLSQTIVYLKFEWLCQACAHVIFAFGFVFVFLSGQFMAARWVFNGKSFINVMFRCSNIDHLSESEQKCFTNQKSKQHICMHTVCIWTRASQSASQFVSQHSLPVNLKVQRIFYYVWIKFLYEFNMVYSFRFSYRFPIHTVLLTISNNFYMFFFFI